MLTNLSLFSGAGGLDLGAKLVGGFKTVAYVERDLWAQGILLSRMRSGDLDDAPVFECVRNFDGRRLQGFIDVVSGGFPCQPHSIASEKKMGGADERNLWPDFLRIAKETETKFVLAENVPGIFDTGYAIEVLASLEETGYCATPVEICACSVGAPHPRSRVFFMAHAFGLRCWPWCKLERSASSDGWREEQAEWNAQNNHQLAREDCDAGNIRWEGKKKWWPAEPQIVRVVDGMANVLDMLRCAGNGVVPQAAAIAWQKIKDLAEGG